MSQSTSRQRFHAALGRAQADRVPLFDEGMRDDVIACWQKQGLSEGVDPFEWFGCDRRERLPVDIMPGCGLGTRPYVEADLPALKRAYNASDPSRLPDDWAASVERWRNRDHVLELFIHRGLYQATGMHDWSSVEQVFVQYADQPKFIRRIMEMVAEFAIELISRVTDDVDVDMLSISDPIGTTHGPLISPPMYRELALQTYQPIIEAAKAKGIETVAFITYANARNVLADVVDAGFNCLWAMETESTDMDYLDIRRQFGLDLALIGGIDLDAVIAGGRVLQQHLEQRVPTLLSGGNYLPLADGRIRSTVSFKAYREYRRQLEKIVNS